MFLQDRDFVFLEDRDSVCLEDRDSVCLEDRDYCPFQQDEFLYLWKTETVVVFHTANFCMFEKQIMLFFCNKKSSPNPSYLHSGEFVLPWDPKNWSSHNQIVHREILRAQMYLKSDETEGNLLSEHMNIIARNY